MKQSEQGRIFRCQIRSKPLETKKRARPGLTRYWLAIAWMFCMSPAGANWGTASPNYEAEARIIGAWRGEYAGQSFEFAVWPSKHTHGLTGVMVWGECKAAVNMSGSDLLKMPAGHAINDANPDLNRYLYSFSTFPNQINMRNNRCPGESRPGYGGFFLNADEPVDELKMLSYATYPKLKTHPSRLTRSAPSSKLAEVIRWVDEKTSDNLTTMAKEVVFDPARSYYQSSERQAATALAIADGLSFVSIVGVVYRIESEYANDSRERFDLIVADTKNSILKNNFDIGEVGGEGVFYPISQEMRITIHRETELCGVVKDPDTKYDVGHNQGVTGALEELGDTRKSWVLAAPKSHCADIVTRSCKVVSCTRWWGEQVSDPDIAAPLITDSPEIADIQAQINRHSFQ